MKTTHNTFLALAIIAALSSCKRENEIPVLLINPSGYNLTATSGDVITFGISATSDNSSLARLVVQSKRENSFTVTLKDSVLNGTSFFWNWEYMVAHSTEPYSELLTFTLYDANGEQMSTTRTLWVTLSETVLAETSGHLFYSKSSGVHPESAFDLEERVQVIYTTDSIRRDIQDNTVGGNEVLSRSWISPAGGRFVRFNSFDYANATDVSVRNAFNSGIPLEQLDNVTSGDIIITRLGSLAPNIGFYAVLRITDVVDDTGTADNDRYVFNMKWVSFVE